VAEELPTAVRELVAQCLHSMEEVDALLLLAGHDAALSVPEIRERLRLPESSLSPASILELEQRGLVVCEIGQVPRYRYAPDDEALRKAVGLLALAYRERPVTLVRLVYNRPQRAQTFTEAFREPKENER
jgi:hypothetical protein